MRVEDGLRLEEDKKKDKDKEKDKEEEKEEEKVEEEQAEKEGEKAEEKEEKKKGATNRWKLIDLDAAASFSQHKPGFAGSKSSSAYCAPEIIFESENGVQVKTYPPEQAQDKPLYEAQPASPQLDMWSFGAVLYLMVNPILATASQLVSVV
jgi:serine/threonine protein kinase